MNPVDVTMALGKGATHAGREDLRRRAGHRRAAEERPRDRRAAPRFGDIQAEYVVNCAGMWARELGALSGVDIPNQAAEHYYLITEAIKDLPPNMPVLEDPSPTATTARKAAA